MDDIYENVDVYNANKNCKVLIVFDVEMITVMLSKKKYSTNSNRIIY